MSIEKELILYLSSESKELSTKSRDIDLIIYYYGFSSNEWPTLEDAAIAFDVGDSEGRRSERPRQIINNKFRNKAELNNLPSLASFHNILKSSKIHSSETLQAKCLANDLLEEGGNLIALLRLLHDLGEGKEYGAYSLNLNDLTRSAYTTNQDILISEKESIKKLRTALKKAKTLPGLIGISRLDYLESEIQKENVDIELLTSILKKDPDSWFYSYQNNDYYLFESRDNTLVNSLEKIKQIADHENIDVLTDALSNSLKRRTPPQGRNYPPDGVIKKYLLSSKYTTINSDIVFLKIDSETLTDVEKSVVNYMRQTNIDDYPTISSHLISLGYGKPTIDKAVFHSPLIHVDKSKGRHHYKYRVVGSKNLSQPESLSSYEEFRQRLLKVSSEGTDGSSETVTRKEHYILSEWLFKGKDFERCAICKKMYSTKSLVTAHKKRRADCAENERTDPHIVMPLCNFGCDYIYENELIYIENGVISISSTTEGKYLDEITAISPLIGKNIEARWLEGANGYFKNPNNKKLTKT